MFNERTGLAHGKYLPGRKLEFHICTHIKTCGCRFNCVYELTENFKSPYSPERPMDNSRRMPSRGRGCPRSSNVRPVSMRIRDISRHEMDCIENITPSVFYDLLSFLKGTNPIRARESEYSSHYFSFENFGLTPTHTISVLLNAVKEMC